MKTKDEDKRPNPIRKTQRKKRKDTNTQRHKDTKRQRQQDTKAQRRKDTKRQRHKDAKTQKDTQTHVERGGVVRPTHVERDGVLGREQAYHEKKLKGLRAFKSIAKICRRQRTDERKRQKDKDTKTQRH